MTAQASTGDIQLTCTPEKAGDRIILAYAVANRGAEPIFVMDAHVGIVPGTSEPAFYPGWATIWHGRDNYAHVLNGLAPRPTDRVTIRRIVPAALRLEPGATLSRRIELVEPLAEQSPYFPLAAVRDYRISPIEGIALHIDVLPASAPGLREAAVPLSPDHRDISADNLPKVLRRLAVSFRAQGLHLLVRTGPYPRPD